MGANPAGESTDLGKIAEDELIRLQRQLRIMETERNNLNSASKPKIRKQRQVLQSLMREYEQLVLDLKVSKSASNVKKDICVSNEISELLLEQENVIKEITSEKYQTEEMNFLVKQLEKEIFALKSKQCTEQEQTEQVALDQQRISQLENRLEVTKKRFNSVNTSNIKLRQDIDHLLQERANFNTVWAKTLNTLANGKNTMMNLVEQSTQLYDQREEWCRKLQVLKDKAHMDQIEHAQEMAELQRQLDHDSKLQQFLSVKGSKRVMAELEAKEAAKRKAQKDMEIATQERHKEILKEIQEYTKELDLERVIAQFTKQDEENYALFNYVNEVNQELEALAGNVTELKVTLENTRLEKKQREAMQQDTIDTLKEQLEIKNAEAELGRETAAKAQEMLDTSLNDILNLFNMMRCDAAPILQLLGTTSCVDVQNAMLYLKTIERKTLDIVNNPYYTENVKKMEETRAKPKIETPRSQTKTKGAGKEPKKVKPKTNFADRSPKDKS